MPDKRIIRGLLKVLHELATVGLMGTAVVVLVLHPHARAASPDQLIVLRAAIADLSRIIFVPSLVLVLVSGLAAMALNSAFHDAAWVWLKALSGVAVFEGALFAVAGNAQRGVALAQSLAAGDAAAPAAMVDLLRHERAGCIAMIVLSVINIVLGIWRPRMASYLPAETPAPPAPDDALTPAASEPHPAPPA